MDESKQINGQETFLSDRRRKVKEVWESTDMS